MSFSKKDVEANALEIQRQGGLDFTTDQEKKMINEVFNNAMECLSEEDRALPQVTNGKCYIHSDTYIHTYTVYKDNIIKYCLY